MPGSRLNLQPHQQKSLGNQYHKASEYVRKSFGGNTQTKYNDKFDKMAAKNFDRRPVSQSGRYTMKRLRGSKSKRIMMIKDPDFYRFRDTNNQT